MLTDVVGDSAVGLSTLSQTNTVAVYVPESLGVHDIAGLNDCPPVKEPVIHANDTVTPFSSTATVFVWESVDNPTALSPTTSVTINVV